MGATPTTSTAFRPTLPLRQEHLATQNALQATSVDTHLGSPIAGPSSIPWTGPSKLFDVSTTSHPSAGAVHSLQTDQSFLQDVPLNRAWGTRTPLTRPQTAKMPANLSERIRAARKNLQQLGDSPTVESPHPPLAAPSALPQPTSAHPSRPSPLEEKTPPASNLRVPVANHQRRPSPNPSSTKQPPQLVVRVSSLPAPSKVTETTALERKELARRKRTEWKRSYNDSKADRKETMRKGSEAIHAQKATADPTPPPVKVTRSRSPAPKPATRTPAVSFDESLIRLVTGKTEETSHSSVASSVASTPEPKHPLADSTAVLPVDIDPALAPQEPSTQPPESRASSSRAAVKAQPMAPDPNTIQDAIARLNKNTVSATPSKTSKVAKEVVRDTADKAPSLPSAAPFTTTTETSDDRVALDTANKENVPPMVALNAVATAATSRSAAEPAFFVPSAKKRAVSLDGSSDASVTPPKKARKSRVSEGEYKTGTKRPWGEDTPP